MDLTTGFVPILAGLVCGVLSGLGIGGGSLLMLWLTQAAGIELGCARMLNLLYFLPTAGSSLFLHGKNRFIKWAVVWPAALAGIGAALLALWLVPSVDTPWVKKAFGTVLIAAGLRELLGRQNRQKTGSLVGEKAPVFADKQGDRSRQNH